MAQRFAHLGLMAVVISFMTSSVQAETSAEQSAAIARGGAIFKSVCSGYCHQIKPTTSDALYLFDCEWKHGGTDEDIFNTISNGVPGSRMIAFGDKLPEGYDDTWRVIAWLKENSQCRTKTDASEAGP